MAIASEPGSQTINARQAYYERIASDHMTPLWEVLGALVPKQPNSPAQATLWRYATPVSYTHLTLPTKRIV